MTSEADIVSDIVIVLSPIPKVTLVTAVAVLKTIDTVGLVLTVPVFVISSVMSSVRLLKD